MGLRGGGSIFSNLYIDEDNLSQEIETPFGLVTRPPHRWRKFEARACGQQLVPGVAKPHSQSNAQEARKHQQRLILAPAKG